MTTPIDRESVERLRRKMVGSSCFPDLLFPKADVEAVLDECDALRAALDAAEAENKRLRRAALDAAAHLVAATSLLRKGGKKAAPSDKMFEQMLVDYEATIKRARAALQENPDV